MQAWGERKDAIHILVAGYTRIHTELLADVFKRDRCLQVVGAVSSCEAVFEVAAQSWVDVAVISSNLDEQPERGFEVVRGLRARYPGIRAIMLLDSAKQESIIKAFRAGAKGIFAKHSPLIGLSKCVRCVHQGQIWINHEELELVLDSISSAPVIHRVDANGTNLLTRREVEVIECVAEGLANHEIGERLGLSKHTVKNYLFRIFDKLGVSNRVELVFLTLDHSTPWGMRDESQPTIGGNGKKGLPQKYDLARDPETAYLQCLVAERANLDAGIKIVVAKKRLAAFLTPEQVLQAEQQVPASAKKEMNSSPSTLSDEGTSNVFRRELTGCYGD